MHKGASLDGPALRLRDIAKSFGRHPVLRDVDLDVARGETVALLGANGAGKSTLLRIAATLARPGMGTVEVAGVSAKSAPERVRGHLSILTQDAPVYPDLTPTEQVTWWARAQGLQGVDAARRLAVAGLTASAAAPARQLSRGQRQRLALTLALLPADRPLLLLDEPFAALDDAGAAWLEAELKARRGRQAVVLAVHDAAHARALADRVLLLHAGRLEAS